MPVTMVQIARHAGVSQPTVSRVLSGKGAGVISDATRRHVLAIAERLNFTPNRLARGLVTGRTGVVALWTRNPDAPFYAGILRCVQELAAADGYEMILSGFRDRGGEDLPSGGRQAGSAGWPVDGVLAADCPRRVEACATSVGAGEPARPAIVAMASSAPPEVDSVTFDPVCGIEAAARHLVEIGCRRVLHVSGMCSIPEIREARSNTFAAVLSGFGLDVTIAMGANESREAARRTMIEAWRQAAQSGGQRPYDAVCCINDDCAIGAHRGLADLGVRVGREVALVGCDDIDDAAFLTPSLTTIRQPVDELCARAWALLRARMHGESAHGAARPAREVIAPRLVVRESTEWFVPERRAS